MARRMPRYLRPDPDPNDDQWTIAAVRERYRRYCRQLGTHPRDLTTRYPDPDPRWLNQTMRLIMDGIARHDPACVMVGIDLVEEDRSLPWGRLLKSDMARALRQHARLTEPDKARLRNRFTDMLLRGYLPREYKEYAKLFRKIGLDGHAQIIERQADQSNRFIRRWCWYLLQDHTAPRPTLPRLHKW
jgi:hypothetical protein